MRMSLPFFYFDTPWAENGLLELDEANSKHIAQVLRMREGELLYLTDGAGHLLTAEIVVAHKRATRVKLLQQHFVERKGRHVTIAISPVKNNARFEWFLEKATEIGVAAIVPIVCQRTVKENFRYERMRQILISAMLQSRQTWLPQLKAPVLFKDAVQATQSQQKFIAHCMEDGHRTQLASLSLQNEVAVFIGPEGDFTADEVTMALSAGFEPILLGENRLRTETAGVVAAALLILT